MFFRQFLYSIICLFVMFQSISVGQANEAKELFWEDLMPKDYVLPSVSMEYTAQMTQVEPNAPLVKELDGKLVKIPGFIVPLEGDTDSITEFLLVPYFGACIHVPPPPSNQIVHVKIEQGVDMSMIIDAVWVTGNLSTEGWVGEIASVGYTMKGVDVEPYL